MKLKNKIVALILSVACAMPLTACGGVRGGSDNPLDNEQIDTKRTQLFVNNFYGGYGSDWIAAVKSRYEELHKDDVYEEGKKGIQIYVNNQKTHASEVGAQILSNRDEVYFSEYSYYYTLKADGLLGDITEAVTADLSEYGDAEGSTIEKKLTTEQRTFYGIEEADGTHYYGLPHYSGYSGLIYNVDLFDQKGYYFIDVPTGSSIEDYFIYNSTDKKSAGPDGEYGTRDDGLPATYDEFWMLCSYIFGAGDTPIVWTGTNYGDYLANLMQALVADYEGLEQMMLNYNFGNDTVKQATDLGTIVNGNFVKDDTPTTITSDNGFELYRQQGKYEALSFLQQLVTDDNKHNSLAFNGSYSHMNAQEDFLYAGHDNGITKPIAMLCDGIWWESEATDTFNAMVNSKGEEFSKTARNFAFMPLPKANTEKANVNKQNGKDAKKNTLFDHIYSICFMKSNIAEWKKPIAIDFIKFVHSDASLVEFTQITNTPKAFKYEMTSAQKNKMSPFGRSVIELQEHSDIVYPYSSIPRYVNNQSSFTTYNMYRLNATTQWPAVQFQENRKYSAAQYFTQMGSYNKGLWGSLV